MGFYVRTWVTDLAYFPFWAGGKQIADRFTYDEMQQIGQIFEDLNNGEHEMPIDDTTINDTFWFEPEMLCEWVGITINELMNRNNERI